MLYHMRTTFLIDDDVYRQVKVLAAQERCTVTSLVEEALQKLLDEHVAKQAASKPEPFRFHTFSSPLVDPNLDLSSNSAVLDAMDEEDIAAWRAGEPGRVIHA